MKNPIFLLLFIYAATSFAQTTPTLTTAQKKNLKETAKQIVIAYNNNLAMLGDASLSPDDKKLYANDNLSKFESEKIKIFNDLDPTGNSGKEFSLRSYQNNIITWFPNGVTLTYSNYNAGDIYTDNSGNFLILKVQYERQIKGTNVGGTAVDDKRMLDAYIKFPFTIQTNSFSNPKISKIGFQTDDLKDYKKIIAGNTGNDQTVKEETKDDVKLTLTPAEEKTFISSALLLAEQTLETFKGLGDNNVSFPEDKPMFKSKILERLESPNSLISNDLIPESSGNEIMINKYLDDFVDKYPNGISYNYTKPHADAVYNNINEKFLVVKTIFDLELNGTDLSGKKLSSKKQMNIYVKYTNKGSQIYKIAYHTENNPELEKIVVTQSADAKSNSTQKLINDLLNAKKESEEKLRQKVQELDAKIEEAKRAREAAEAERKKKEEEEKNLKDKKIKDKYSYADGYKHGTILKFHASRLIETMAVFSIEQKLFERKEKYVSLEVGYGKYFSFPMSVGHNSMNAVLMDTISGNPTEVEGSDTKQTLKSGYTFRIELKKYYRLKTLHYMYYSVLWFRSSIDFTETGHYGFRDDNSGQYTILDHELSLDCNRKMGGVFFTIGQQKPFGNSRILKDWYVGLGIRKWTVTNTYSAKYVTNAPKSDTNLFVMMGIKIGFRLGKPISKI